MSKKAIIVSCFELTVKVSLIDKINYFVNHGYEVKVLLSDFNHHSKEHYSLNEENVTQIHVPAYAKNISPARLYSHHVFAKEVSKIISKEKPDVIFCRIPPNSLVKKIIEYKRKSGAKVIFEVYDLWPESFPVGKLGTILAAPLSMWRNLRDKYIDECDLLITVSDDGVEKLSSLFPNSKSKIKQLRPTNGGAKIPEYAFDIENEIKFIYIGNINSITDIELGVRLLGGLAEKRKVKLNLVGGGANADEFVRKLEDADVDVVCHGIVFDEERKCRILADSHLGLNIPKPEIGSTMAIKAIDYMSHGLPFINSGLGDNHDNTEHYHTGINISYDTVNDAVNQIMALRTDDLRNMSVNCISTYQKLFGSQDLEAALGIIINE